MPTEIDPSAELLSEEELKESITQLPDWSVIHRDGESILSREFNFSNFEEALTFVNQVGEKAEEANHHPQMTVTWGMARVEWWSHSAGGVTANDLLMAQATDQIIKSS